MERFELAIVVLLVVLVMICVYIAASWTIWRRTKKKSPVEEWLDKNDVTSSAFRKGFVPEGEEGLPKITITPVQPRPDISEVRHANSWSASLQLHGMESKIAIFSINICSLFLKLGNLPVTFWHSHAF